ncbi:MAG: hypothetical protein J3K34DRAFT_444248 [Monoraphidium minutum]|nr:MAG: hypothetical protein J3K34DRAFT_444248 [Monoraphidium minutum]
MCMSSRRGRGAANAARRARGRSRRLRPACRGEAPRALLSNRFQEGVQMAAGACVPAGLSRHRRRRQRPGGGRAHCGQGPVKRGRRIGGAARVRRQPERNGEPHTTARRARRGPLRAAHAPRTAGRATIGEGARRRAPRRGARAQRARLKIIDTTEGSQVQSGFCKWDGSGGGIPGRA